MKLYRQAARCCERTKLRISMLELIFVTVAITLIAIVLAVWIALWQNRRDERRVGEMRCHEDQ